MSGGRSPGEQRARQEFVADPVVVEELGLCFADLADADVRAMVIRAEHPELEAALSDEVAQVDGPAGPMNPRLHLVLHEIVATQLWADEPPEVWETAKRLLDAGYERHEVLHMLGRPAAEHVWEALENQRPYDRDSHIAALNELPESWERKRAAIRLEHDHTPERRAAPPERKQARRRVKASRRRNRRG